MTIFSEYVEVKIQNLHGCSLGLAWALFTVLSFDDQLHIYKVQRAATECSQVSR